MLGSVIKNNSTNLFKNLQSKKNFYAPFHYYKYVYFDGGIFLDCFSPKFPGTAYDRLVYNTLRMLQNKDSEWKNFTIALIISITKKCVYRCEHCYAVQTLGSKDVLTLEQLFHIAKELIRLGIAVIGWEGGEPLLRFNDLLTLIRRTHKYADAWLASTAYGLTHEKARKLKRAGLSAAIISLDHWDPAKHNKFRKNEKAFDMAVNGVRIFRENGILPSICICATKDLDEEGLYQYLELAKEIGVGFIQILDATPSGNYLGQDVMLSNKQLDMIRKFHMRVNRDPEFRDYPSISARTLLEGETCYGCAAGNALCYVDSSGLLQACDLLQISFGNVLEEGVEKVYKRMKDYFPHPYGGRCPAQSLHKQIADVYSTHESLPLPFEKCEDILEKITRRGLPKNLRE